MLRCLTGVSSPRLSFKVAVLGKYYDNITPFGVGGQPFQVMYLKRLELPGGEAAAVPIAGYLAQQIAFILIAVVIFIFGNAVTDSAALKIPAAVGLLFYIFVPAVIILFTISPALTGKALRFLCALFGRLKILKSPEAAQVRAVEALTSARGAITVILGKRRLSLEILLLSLLYQLSLCSMPYFVLHTFGSDLGFLSVFCTAVFIYLCITFIPTPGNSGVAEGSFYTLFSVVEQNYLFWVMLIWRFFCYYAFILTGVLVLSSDAVGKKRRENR
jgi:uncharacterized protein (TIRG00374 family)